ncbi:phage terminase large subunit-like protein [Maritalea mobilis]|uniref:Phage terminase large subunit-like protein n=1 Tax=Maritalea mobilis TaxID=483324 RepID=A0A4R6VUE4_9HYPH|nr:terminase family protein [Maritalea mobilis]TDQ63831.1 phage terminase large subunit-like protein [Maritalea mobilis]
MQNSDLIAELSDAEVQALYHDWRFWARPDQVAPDGNWLTWLMLGGRGAGKTRAGAEWVREKALGLNQKAASPIALVGEDIADARAVMIEGVSGLLAIHPTDQQPVFHKSRGELEWPNGAVAKLFSAHDPDALRGPQFAAAWADEYAKWPNPQICWDMLQFALRLGDAPQQMVTTTPRPIPALKKLMQDKNCVVTRASTSDNAANLAPNFFSTVTAHYAGTRLGRQELDGEVLEAAEGALWHHAQFDELRAASPAQFDRVVIAIDPPVTSHKHSDQCGIVVAGQVGEVTYVLADLSFQPAPALQWARKVIHAFDQFDADLVVAETNQGGDLVGLNLKQLVLNLPIKQVRAHRSKYARAEPVAMLYERGLVRHVGDLRHLEDEMCAFAPDQTGQGSPDRMDALVWAITELALGTDARPRIRNF